MKLFSNFILTCTLMGVAFAQISASGSAGANTATQATAPTSAATAQASSSTAAAAHAGAAVPVELSKSIDSKKAKVGDEVTAKVINDVRSGGALAIPRGSKLLGKVTEANARAKGDATSSLGIVFDRAVLKNGTTLHLVSTIQAVIAPPEQSMPLPEASGGGGGGGMEGPEGNRGSSTSSPVGAIGNTAGSAVGAVGRTADSATQAADLGANARVGANGPAVTSQTTGVVGIKGLELNAGTSANASGSVLTTGSKSVKLESGTRMLVNVSAASNEAAAPPDARKQP